MLLIPSAASNVTLLAQSASWLLGTGVQQQDSMPVRWKSDLNKVVITSNLEHRGWKPAEDDEWDIYWASVSTAQQIFAANSLVKLRPGQLINHFPNHFELTHKVHGDANLCDSTCKFSALPQSCMAVRCQCRSMQPNLFTAGPSS